MSTTTTPNPLLKLKLNGFETWALSQLFGVQWETKIWNSAVSSFDTWAATQASVDAVSIQAYVQSHVDSFLQSIAGSNIFFDVLISAVVNPLIASLTSGLLAYVTNEATSLVASNVAIKPAVVADPTVTEPIDGSNPSDGAAPGPETA